MTHLCLWRDSCKCDTTLYVGWYFKFDAFMYVKWLIQRGYYSHIYVTWYIHLWDGHSMAVTWLMHSWYDFICRMICEMFDSSIWHDSFMRDVTDECDMTLLWHDISFVTLNSRSCTPAMLHMNVSCHKWIHSRFEFAQIQMNESCHVWMSHITFMSHVMDEGVMSNRWIKHL